MLFMTREDGQALMEYGLAIVLVAIVVVVIATVLSGQVQAFWQLVSDKLGATFT